MWPSNGDPADLMVLTGFLLGKGHKSVTSFLDPYLGCSMLSISSRGGDCRARETGHCINALNSFQDTGLDDV